MEFMATAMLVLLIKKLVDFLKALTNKDLNAVVTQLVAAVAGVLALLLVAQTGWANGVVIGGTALADLNFWSLLFVGVTAASGASVLHDVVKALDNTDSAKGPTLMPSTDDNG